MRSEAIRSEKNEPTSRAVNFGQTCTSQVSSIQTARQLNRATSGTTGPRDTTLRLAIIGSGIAGCAAADFAHQRFNDVEIDIFEKQSRIGGRICETEFDSTMFEAGAMAFHEKSHYIMKYVNRFDLERADPLGPIMSRSYAVWDGQGFLSESSVLPRGKLMLLGRYRLSLPRLWWQSRRVFKRFNSLYDLLEEGEHFKSPDEMLAIVNLHDIAQRPATEYLRDHNISSTCIKEILDPISRTLYGQDARMSALVDLIVFKATVFERWYSIRGGNTRLLECLIDTASATVYTDRKIASIAANTGTYTLTAVESTEKYGPYDAVVIATPLEKADIEFENVDTSVASGREYQSMYNGFVKGILDPTYFGVEAQDDLPDVISTTADVEEPFNTIEIARRQDDANVYLLNATSKLTNEILSDIFLHIRDTKQFSWDAYPVYEPPLSWPPFRLDNGIYYVNAMESAISTMETEVMGSQNVINLLSSDLTQ